MRCWHSFLALTLAACAAEGTTEQVDALGAGLRLGDVGPRVHALHEHLYQFGYFPNAELAREFSNWRAVVPDGPADLDEYDEQTERAVSAFQGISRLPVTGVYDAATQQAMESPRCGVPDSAEAGDEKWARLPSRWTSGSLMYSVNTVNTPRGKAETFSNQIDQAFAAWQARSGYTLTRVPTGGHIRVSWGNLNAPAIGRTTTPLGGTPTTVPIVFAINQIRSDGSLTPVSWMFNDEPFQSGAVDFASTAVHEAGHALGLAHSSIGRAVMDRGLSVGEFRSALFNDDIQGIHALQPGYSSIWAPSNLKSMIAGSGGDLWVTGGASDSNGSQIWKRDPSSGVWFEHPFGGRAKMLALADSGILWHINNNGDLYRAENGWAKKDGRASFIAANQSEVWHLGWAVTRGSRDHDIHRWNGTAWNQVAGQASDIALVRSPISNRIEVWYINEAGEVYRQFPGESARRGVDPPGGACGIAGGQDGMVYALQCPLNTNGMPIFMWNEQTRILANDGTELVSSGERWVPVQGRARDITSVQTNARIFHLGTDGGVWMSR